MGEGLDDTKILHEHVTVEHATVELEVNYISNINH
jgi:hypothetical protein